jgi:hypothetical protein
VASASSSDSISEHELEFNMECDEHDNLDGESSESDFSEEIKKKRETKIKRVIRKPASKMVPRKRPLKPDEVDFVCSECNEFFESGQALGGHMSRVHPGQSTSYARKLQRRDERCFDRELLRLAKIRHAETQGANAALDRVKIRRFKKEIKE